MCVTNIYVCLLCREFFFFSPNKTKSFNSSENEIVIYTGTGDTHFGLQWVQISISLACYDAAFPNISIFIQIS